MRRGLLVTCHPLPVTHYLPPSPITHYLSLYLLTHDALRITHYLSRRSLCVTVYCNCYRNST